jgi:hypothetical protein
VNRGQWALSRGQRSNNPLDRRGIGGVSRCFGSATRPKLIRSRPTICGPGGLVEMTVDRQRRKPDRVLVKTQYFRLLAGIVLRSRIDMSNTLRGFAFLFVLAWAAPPAHAQDADPPAQDQQDQTARPTAIEYSEGYATRAKIHKVASFATLPLIGTEAILGQSLYNDPYSRTSAKRGAHIAVGTAITGLFALNSVTGVWNMVESWHDPHHQVLRRIHGFSMLAADAGFFAAYGTGPGGRNLVNIDSEKSTHRAVVFTTMSIATASYLMMLIGNK